MNRNCNYYDATNALTRWEGEGGSLGPMPQTGQNRERLKDSMTTASAPINHRTTTLADVDRDRLSKLELFQDGGLWKSTVSLRYGNTARRGRSDTSSAYAAVAGKDELNHRTGRVGVARPQKVHTGISRKSRFDFTNRWCTAATRPTHPGSSRCDVVQTVGSCSGRHQLAQSFEAARVLGGAIAVTTRPCEQPQYDANWEPEVWHPTQEEREALQRYESMIQRELANPVQSIARPHRRNEGRLTRTIK